MAKKSNTPKGESPEKILRWLSREEEMQRNGGRWVAMNRAFKNKKKYNRTDKKRELRKDLSSFYLKLSCV